MSWELRYLVIIVMTVVMTSCSLIIYLRRKYFAPLFHLNSGFLELLGVDPTHVPWVRFLANWLITTCIAVVQFTLLINIIDTIVFLTGGSGIVLDPVIVPLTVIGLALSVFLFIVTFLPVLVMPAAAPTAFLLMTFLQFFGLFDFIYDLSLVSTFLFFAAVSIGFVTSFLFIYVLIRHYIGTIRRRHQGSRQDTEAAPPIEESIQ